jgi:hypothetical protein
MMDDYLLSDTNARLASSVINLVFENYLSPAAVEESNWIPDVNNHIPSSFTENQMSFHLR